MLWLALAEDWPSPQKPLPPLISRCWISERIPAFSAGQIVFDYLTNNVGCQRKTEFLQYLTCCYNFLFFCSCQNSWCTTIPFWRFPLYVVIKCTGWYAIPFSCCMSLELPTVDSFHGCLQLLITPLVLFSLLLVHSWHCYYILLFININ